VLISTQKSIPYTSSDSIKTKRELIIGLSPCFGRQAKNVYPPLAACRERLDGWYD
jgi:hypothetical protein